MGERGRRAAVGLAVGAVVGLLARSLDLYGLVSYWGPRAPAVLMITVLGGLLWTTRLRPFVAGAAAALALLWLLAAFTPLSAWLAEGLVRRDPEGRADAVFVLASRIQGNGDLTAVSMSRLLHGLELVGAGRAPRLVLSEIQPPSRSYAEVARLLMEHLGVHAELLVVGPIHNTRDEAVAVSALCRKAGLRRLIVVTSPSHSRRACATLEAEGLVVLSSPSVETRFAIDSLDEPDDRLLAFGNLLHERLGLLVYRWRGFAR